MRLCHINRTQNTSLRQYDTIFGAVALPSNSMAETYLFRILRNDVGLPPWRNAGGLREPVLAKPSPNDQILKIISKIFMLSVIFLFCSGRPLFRENLSRVQHPCKHTCQSRCELKKRIKDNLMFFSPHCTR